MNEKHYSVLAQMVLRFGDLVLLHKTELEHQSSSWWFCVGRLYGFACSEWDDRFIAAAVTDACLTIGFPEHQAAPLQDPLRTLYDEARQCCQRITDARSAA